METYKSKMKNVPFGNSVFQIEHFSRGAETPTRTYRNCLLQLHQKYKALKECEFRRKRLEIDIDEIKAKSAITTEFEQRRLEIDVEEKQFNLDEEIKLIEDCIVEIKTYENILNQLPDFSRTDFEKAEGVYWEKKLLNDARLQIMSLGYIAQDTQQSLKQIGINVERSEQGQIVFQKVGEVKNDNFLCFNPTDTD